MMAVRRRVAGVAQPRAGLVIAEAAVISSRRTNHSRSSYIAHAISATVGLGWTKRLKAY